MGLAFNDNEWRTIKDYMAETFERNERINGSTDSAR